MDYTGYVNIKQGTFSNPRFSCGNTLPLVASPFGMNHFCIQTMGADDGWFYHPSHRQTEGIRLTHQASPWVRDYGHFVFMPQSGNVYVRDFQRASGYSELEMRPGSMELYLKRYQVLFRIAASDRGAIMDMRWDTEETPRFALLPFDYVTNLHLNPGNSALTGWTNAWGDGTRKDFRIYFYLKFDAAVDAANTWITHNSGEMVQATQGEGVGIGINIAFDLPRGQILTARLGTSFISEKQAKKNAMEETGQLTYDALNAETAEKWNGLLSKIRITDTEDKMKTFYSCLHRCFLFPRIFYEYDEQGKPVHYSAGDGTLQPGVMYTDNGFWDTCRTLYPLFALLIPQRLKEMLQGYLNFYREEGWLPKWLAPGERGIMPGTLVDAVLADCAQKGMLTQQQMELALEGMLKNATIPSGDHLHGRIGVADYVRKGYVPCDKYGESANNTLDACFCDYGISRVAGLLGKRELEEEYLARSRNYKRLFDPAVGFIRGLREDGSRSEDFSPFRWGGEYCEGGPWQNGFGVYHDMDGLAGLYGGTKALEEKLDELFTAPAHYEIGSYPCEIHEMTEMAAANFGQCAISNQPSFHLPYLYSYLGCPEKCSHWIQRITAEAFDSSDKGFPGDEDNGSMAAWYVLSVLGIYPLCPGKPEYVTGRCCVPEVRMTLGNGNTLSIRGPGYRVSVDGKPCENSVITHSQLINAKEILFSE